MDPKDLEFEETLADSELLLKNTARSMDEDAEFTLESILAEYGQRHARRARTGRKSKRAARGGKAVGKGRPSAEKGGDGEKNGG